jgi:hypothetical protein
MITPSCPFSTECQFLKIPARTPSDVFLRQLYCYTAGYAACEISKSILKGERPPQAPARMVSSARRHNASAV